MSKTVTILRGVPGSGKSTYVKKLFAGREANSFDICSADHYFLVSKNDQPAEYHFDATLLGKAHQHCWKHFHQLLQREGMHNTLTDIVVDNTNIRPEEIAPYVLPAEVFGCTVKIVTLLVDPDVAHARCVHGVPLKAIERMATSLEKIQLPPRWTQEVVRGEL